MIRKFLKKLFYPVTTDAPLRQGQFLEYVIRDYQTHLLIIVLLLILGGLQILQSVLFLL